MSEVELTLKRWLIGDTGVFGNLWNEHMELIAVTLEHAYPVDSVVKAWAAKIPDGKYTCVRGAHVIGAITEYFETFEITGVPGHSGLLFHWGNWNKDSEGCVLLGGRKIDSMIVDSRKVFASFMKMLEGVDTFELTVSSS